MSATNVYEELGLPDAPEMLLKADIAYHIVREIRERDWSQEEAAKFLGTKQSVVSNIVRGQFRSMTIERLMGYLRKFGPQFRVVLEVSAPPDLCLSADLPSPRL